MLCVSVIVEWITWAAQARTPECQQSYCDLQAHSEQFKTAPPHPTPPHPYDLVNTHLHRLEQLLETIKPHSPTHALLCLVRKEKGVIKEESDLLNSLQVKRECEFIFCRDAMPLNHLGDV